MERRGRRGQEVEIAKVLARHADAQARRATRADLLSEWRWSRNGWSMKRTAIASDTGAEGDAPGLADDDDAKA